MLPQLNNRFGDLAIVHVAVAIDKKEIFPGLPLARARLDLGHVNAIAAERRQRAIQRPNPINDAEHDAGAVIARRRAALPPQYQEARCVGSVVLNVELQHRHAIFFRRQHARNRGRLFFFRGEFGRARIG